MPMIDTALLQPASDAVQAAIQAMRAANNEIAYLQNEQPRNAEKIRHFRAEMASEEKRYHQALFRLSVAVHAALEQASAAE
ncbi:hypothetical protein EDF83_0623 [Pseudomonas protegens]|uniref:hypothetical protein n=1 Tax=Pseudomonas TaxID=286 RepID=UPI000F4A90C3|nr:MULTISPECIES: hypothetical protein [Pseudomonas]MCS4261071.1 putative nucleic acid-binding Zn-ribbon protein [Pseudomonas sp. BIGb0176]ROQ61366.1 hypothetical protein EDF83_0623 [Pseudomonas protegens]ROQ83685.1 hypothetical protein EC837_0540 [Pseudomonas protegens]